MWFWNKNLISGHYMGMWCNDVYNGYGTCYGDTGYKG